MKKHVLITGGAGFIGHHLCRVYLDNGYKVTVVDNLDIHSNYVRLIKYRLEQIQSKQLAFIQEDCGNTFSLIDKLSNNTPSYIVHLASLSNQAAVNENKYTALSSIAGRSFNMAMLAEKFNAKLIHVSSSMVYGNFITDPQPEDALLKPTNLYGLLKKQSEELVLQTWQQSVIIRPSAVYGAGDNFNRVLGKWINNAIKNLDITINDPASCLDFTHVEDLVQGIYLATTLGVSGEAYNLTFGQARSLGEVALLIKHITDSNSKIIYHNNFEQGVPKRGSLDITKAKNAFNYQPKIDIISGLTSYIKWCQDFKVDH